MALDTKAIVCAALLSLPTASAALAQIHPAALLHDYRVTDLGAPPGFQQSWAYGVNDFGTVVGDAYDVTTNTRHAFRWDGATAWGSGVVTDLGALSGGIKATARAINRSGSVVGASDTLYNGLHSVEYGFLAQAGGMTGLNVPAWPQDTARGNDIDDSGNVVGRALFAPWLPVTAAVWNGGTILDLGSLMPGGTSEAFAINEHGWVVGEATTFDGFNFWTRAFVWDGASMIDLGTFDGPTGASSARDVNDRNEVVGYMEHKSNFEQHAFLWSGGRKFDLGMLPNYNLAVANAINNAGVIVGSGNTADINWHAILWRAGTAHDLNDLVVPTNHGWTLVSAEDVSDAGHIVGYGYPPGGQNLHAFLLTPRSVAGLFSTPPTVIKL